MTKDSRKYLYNVHICPKCKKPITDYTSYTYYKAFNECLGCDHVRGN